MKRENRDDCIYTPGIVVLREDARDEAILPSNARYIVSVITCAAPDLRVVKDGSQYAPTQDDLMELLTRRWRRILAVTATNEADVLILGAFGCGVFANPPLLVAAAFDRASEDIDHCFETIEFAVYTKDLESPNIRAFETLCAIKEGRACAINLQTACLAEKCPTSATAILTHKVVGLTKTR